MPSLVELLVAQDEQFRPFLGTSLRTGRGGPAGWPKVSATSAVAPSVAAITALRASSGITLYSVVSHARSGSPAPRGATARPKPARARSRCGR